MKSTTKVDQVACRRSSDRLTGNRASIWYALLFPACLVALPSMLLAQALPGTPISHITSTARDTQALRIAIYQDTALLCEQRTLYLPAGKSLITFRDIPATIDSTSLQVVPASRTPSFNVLEQNYTGGRITLDELIERSIGKDVYLIKDQRRTKARLLARNIYLINDEVYINPPGVLVLPEVPSGLAESPRLECVVDAGRRGRKSAELCYLAGGLTWEGFYAARLADDGQSGWLQGWMVISNRTGVALKQARVTVVAGSLHTVGPPGPVYAARAMELARAPRGEIAERPSFEYHLYPLPEPITLEDNQTKQISFLANRKCKITRKYLFEWPYNAGRYAPDERNAKTVVKFFNDEASGLGVPLPSGKVRVYKSEEGHPLFLGEDMLHDVAVGDQFKLFVGYAFDVKGSKRRTSFRSLGRSTEESGFEVTLVNRKESPVTVSVVEEFHGDWEILDSTHDYTKKAANSIEFKVDIPPKAEQKIEYSVRIRGDW